MLGPNNMFYHTYICKCTVNANVNVYNQNINCEIYVNEDETSFPIYFIKKMLIAKCLNDLGNNINDGESHT